MFNWKHSVEIEWLSLECKIARLPTPLLWCDKNLTRPARRNPKINSPTNAKIPRRTKPASMRRRTTTTTTEKNSSPPKRARMGKASSKMSEKFHRKVPTKWRRWHLIPARLVSSRFLSPWEGVDFPCTFASHIPQSVSRGYAWLAVTSARLLLVDCRKNSTPMERENHNNTSRYWFKIN